ncbi:hypothetical protein QM716_15900 [Rhodococcus sp. IEGM 1409]|uniref:hypothetical protein n=1 Tax=Rhodococcus sp. IEGM 1409 TaxID=3047082 RepID=UPI0024B6722D|nr:hypothetical protein [Rhodococcus sp. IEGM 1409]MDI9901342.1 hypothetical protein [Rhodococcus sp. IEGM 1409]
MTHVQMPMISTSPLPPIAAEVWRNVVATEIQNHPQRALIGDPSEPEARAVVVADLARRDFDGAETVRPYVKFDATDPDRLAQLVKICRFLVVVLAVAVFVGMCIAYTTYPELR